MMESRPSDCGYQKLSSLPKVPPTLCGVAVLQNKAGGTLWGKPGHSPNPLYNADAARDTHIQLQEDN